MPDLDQQAKNWLDAFNRHDLDGLMSLYHPDVVNAQAHLPQPLRGKEATREDLKGFLVAFPDIHMEFLSTTVRGDTVAVEWSFSGTHEGPLKGPAGPIPATHKRVQLKGAEFITADAQGLITSERGYFDVMSFMGQLGLLPGM